MSASSKNPVRPAQRFGYRSRRAITSTERAEARIRVGLEHAVPPFEVALRVLATTIAGELEEGRRRCVAGERAVVADIHPKPALVGLAPGQHRHRRVVAVQAFGRQHMGLDQRVQGRECNGTRAYLVGQRREAELDALTGIALGLPVERLVLGKLLEQNHRQQVRARPAA